MHHNITPNSHHVSPLNAGGTGASFANASYRIHEYVRLRHMRHVARGSCQASVEEAQGADVVRGGGVRRRCPKQTRCGRWHKPHVTCSTLYSNLCQVQARKERGGNKDGKLGLGDVNTGVTVQSRSQGSVPHGHVLKNVRAPAGKHEGAVHATIPVEFNFLDVTTS